MPLRPHPKVAICGLGRLGAQLAYWLDAGSVPVAALCSRDRGKATVLASALNHRPAVCTRLADLGADADLILLALPDDLLEHAMAQLSTRDLSGKTVVHCVGALSAAALAPLRERSARIAAFHPLQSFGPLDVAGPNVFAGVTISIDADDETYAVVAPLAEALLAVPQLLRLDDRTRAQYHASAVLASNALLTMLDAAIALLGNAGLTPEEAKRALLPLVRGTVNNLENLSPGQALTGPVSRGDVKTAAAHLAALEQQPECALYRDMLRHTVAFARKAGRIDDAQAAAFLKVLQ